ncbi:MAG TPA: hypothetical protein VK463_17905 [Desulfomonilaceae bacterium]|nr:hypothetical protein [Desulfomonilaceae bacterium]
MRMKEALAAAAIVVFCASLVFGNGVDSSAEKTGRYVLYNAKDRCQVVCKGDTPILEMLESGLAYLLDVPLAILSPIACPIVKPVMDKIDPIQGRSVPPSSRK